MANRADRQYEEYKARTEKIQPHEWIINLDALRLFKAGAIRFSGVTHTNCDATYEGTFLAKNGKVFELYLAHGWLEKACVWPNMEAWNAHVEAMPRNIYLYG